MRNGAALRIGPEMKRLLDSGELDREALYRMARERGIKILE